MSKAKAPSSFSQHEKDLLFISQAHLLPNLSKHGLDQITGGFDWNDFGNRKAARIVKQIKEQSRGGK